MRRLLLLLAVWLFATSASAQDRGRFVEIAAFSSAHVAPPHVVVWLPPEYDRSRRRNPVVYMNDGKATDPGKPTLSAEAAIRAPGC